MNDKYYKHFDFYNGTDFVSKNSSFLLKKFLTIQQTTDYTCGPVCAKMVLNFYNIKEYSEMNIAKLMHSNPYPFGTKLVDMVNFFEILGLKCDSSLLRKKNDNGLVFPEFKDFKTFVLENLKKNQPIIVENVDYGGHYRVIIGYDSINENESEDMLIFADPCDDNDGKKDGYNYFPAERFFYMWFDDHCLYENEKKQPFLVVIKN